MILEFSCSNYKSIRAKQRFTSVAGADDSHSDSLISFGSEYRIIRSAAFYGANGSGKTNFLNAINFMKTLVSASIGYQPGQQIPGYHPNKLSNGDEPSFFSMQFEKDFTRFSYSFSIIDNSIVDEKLYFFPNGRPVKIYEREGMDITPGDKFKSYGEAFRISKGILKQNRLFLSCAANYTNIREIEEAFRFFSEDIIFYAPNMDNWVRYSIKLMEEDKDIKKAFLVLLKNLDTGIIDIRISDGKSDTRQERFLNNTGLEAKVIYKNLETDLFSEESSGLQKMFEMLCPIISILKNGKILICDELESGLHEAVAASIIKLFNENRTSSAQLLFSTHNTCFLDSSLFRRDQIWFTELDNERTTDLYSLSSIRNVRKNENLSKGYLEGRYGAIPLLSRNLQKFFSASEVQDEE